MAPPAQPAGFARAGGPSRVDREAIHPTRPYETALEHKHYSTRTVSKRLLAMRCQRNCAPPMSPVSVKSHGPEAPL